MEAISKKKILITLPSLKNDPGGVAHYYRSVMPYLYESDNIGIKIFEIGSTQGKNKLFHQITDQIKFIKQIISMKPDLVHINPSLNFKSFIRDGLFVFWAKKQKIKVVVFFHGWEQKFEKKIHGVLLKFLNLTYKKADSFIVLASEFKAALNILKIKEKIYILTTAVNESLLKRFSIEKKIKRMKDDSTIHILFLSRLEKKKGVFETIDAFKLLLNKQYSITLSIAGDGSLTKEIVEYIDRLGLNNSIFMPGYVKGEEKIDIFEKHDIYCFPTYYGEGMPTSVLEAMAFGMSVVTRPVGGIKDFFKNGKMGYLCENTSPEIIAEMMEKIICDKKSMLNTAEYNYNYAKKHFIASVVAKKLLTIYGNCNL
ncbi:glycosyltransferase family 4 protein [Desulfobacula toluolica]|uniref:Glycosyltransferase, family I n=1 Tax=Desulfobacula toluolica (strain DSM 7467 / Tol2) TaxID=651182 RepID=K0NM99_DESTT|nr:glycosyltransferase family 4 protein [Desulfobacula toluolica]CCK81815.1 glycosyltransferase, family I [Desulfobacula toluolica Tol2]